MAGLLLCFRGQLDEVLLVPLLHARINDVVLPGANHDIAVRVAQVGAPEHFVSGLAQFVVEDGRHAVTQPTPPIQRTANPGLALAL